ncbi:DUF3040 domain-containing protein [Streptomyces sp. NPDC051921]|uniref:DUF3040 domain-containing protein n=1 Tax=Streptomyces sp. NPDC051921 TaxID=3155806 RepID=UPI00343516C3
MVNEVRLSPRERRVFAEIEQTLGDQDEIFADPERTTRRTVDRWQARSVAGMRMPALSGFTVLVVRWCRGRSASRRRA